MLGHVLKLGEDPLSQKEGHGRVALLGKYHRGYRPNAAQ